VYYYSVVDMLCVSYQVIEKRRRDRINNSLSELRRLVPAAFEKQVGIGQRDFSTHCIC